MSDREPLGAPYAARYPGFPWMTWQAIGASVLLTLAMWSSHPGGEGLIEDVGRAGRTGVQAVWDGAIGSLFTSTFYHGSVLHLAFNMMWLLSLGRILEETIHPALWALFFVASAVLASAAELAGSSSHAIGASGVVYAMFGLAWAGRRAYPEFRMIATPGNMRMMLGWGVLCWIATHFGLMAIANFAHAGGLAFGLAVGWLLSERGARRAIGGAGLVALVAVCVCAVLWMPWSAAWTLWKGEHELKARRPAAAIGWLRRSIAQGGRPDRAWVAIRRAALLSNQPAEVERAESALRDMGYGPEDEIPPADATDSDP